jgi:hypothetical protein
MTEVRKSESQMTDNIQISDHCFARYLERTGAIKRFRPKILQIIELGKRVEPKYPVLKLLNHNMKKARYYRYNQWVAVVVENTVVTVMRYSKEKWGEEKNS